MDTVIEKKQLEQDFSRRQFIKATAVTLGAATVLSAAGVQPAQAANKSKGLSLSMAGYRFDRTKALIDGDVKIEGCDIQFQESGIGDINTNVFSGPQTLDVTEIGLHPFMLAYANDGFRDYVLLPIFPLRLFRHKSIFIRTDRNIKSPMDLRGKTIATAGYSSTSLTWIRGILQDEYNIQAKDIHWIISAKDSSAKDAGKVAMAMIFGTLTLSAGLASAYDLPVRGPIPFSTWDTDSNGTIEEQEFNTIREQRQTMVKSSGHMGKNQSAAPSFAQTDTDNDAKITSAELMAMQQGQWNNQGLRNHHGKKQALAKGQHGMRQGHHDKGQTMAGNMGMHHQAVDAETKEKYDTFFKATTELRKEIAIKRAEKRAVMRSDNPDPKQAGQLAGELFELRAQMLAKAEEAGVELAQNKTYRNGHGSGRHGGGSRW